ncbi:hypothetical protein [Natronosalvus caseinilyticus]|uniref:hypothetical protein n=1 Tax=Natronosalvus caseinilyticus TaxID=2953747 RepID=UPI0028A93EF4|nr:hypothetical protein [Natronosalvus caseinilyticus]
MEDNPSDCSLNVNIVKDPSYDASIVSIDEENLREAVIMTGFFRRPQIKKQCETEKMASGDTNNLL